MISKMNGLYKTYIRSYIGLAFVLIMLVSLLLIMQKASGQSSNTLYGYKQEKDVIREAASNIINPGDYVFLSSNIVDVQAALNQRTSEVHSFKPKDNLTFDHILVQWLDSSCQKGYQKSQGSYFIWTDDSADTVANLGHAARALIFFSQFEAVLPYQSVDSTAIDKVLRLDQRDGLIARYCEAQKIAHGKPALVIVDVNEFPPLIGSFTSGSITWLASNETRSNMKRTDYEMKNYPGSLQFILWGPQFTGVWSFTNQETDAYKEAITNIKATNGIVLVDKNVQLGSVPAKFLTECNLTVQSSMFRSLCPKS